MKIKFVYSYVYFLILNRFKRVSRSWDDVKRIGKEFEKEYSTEINKILGVLPQILNQDWKREILDVYIADLLGPSFSHPLTLKAREDHLLMLTILTHELVHQFKMNETDKIKKEKRTNDIVEEVFQKIGIDAKKQIAILREISERVHEIYKENQSPIKDSHNESNVN